MTKGFRFLTILSWLVIFSAGFLFGVSLDSDKQPQLAESNSNPGAAQAEKASVLVDTGEKILVFKDLASENQTVLSLLQKIAQENSDFTLATKDYGDLGVMVAALDGVANGADNKYWQFWVNNGYAQIAADKYPVKPGDAIMWKFTNAQM